MGCSEAGAAASYDVVGGVSGVACRAECRGARAGAAAMAGAAAIAVLLRFVVCAAQKAASAVVLRVVVLPLCRATLSAVRREVMWAALRDPHGADGFVQTGAERSGLTSEGNRLD